MEQSNCSANQDGKTFGNKLCQTTELLYFGGICKASQTSSPKLKSLTSILKSENTQYSTYRRINIIPTKINELLLLAT